jgi:hypothetical protein
LLSPGYDSSAAETNTLEQYVDEVCALLRKKKAWVQRIEVFPAMYEIRNALLGEFKAGVVLGVGSSALADPNPNKFAHIQAIVPANQGVFVWINCAAAINKPGWKEAATLINHWLTYETQMTWFVPRPAYSGFPSIRKP